MITWDAWLWIAAVAGGLAALYGGHRVALWAEERGHIYYLHRTPSGSSAGGFVAMQRIIEPQAHHVLLVRDEAAVFDVDGAAGSDRPPRAARS